MNDNSSSDSLEADTPLDASSRDVNSPVYATAALNKPVASSAAQVSGMTGYQRRQQKRRLMIATSVAIFMAVGGGAGLLLANAQSTEQPATNNLTVKSQAVQLGDLSKRLAKSAAQPVNKLTVNGQVVVDDSLVLTAGERPSKPVAGQIFYDKATNVLTFFNGTDYIGLLGGNVVNTQITNGDVTSISTTNITNIGGGLSGSGTAGTVALFTAGGVLGNSVITQSGSSIQVGSGAGASATTVQAGTGDLQLSTGLSSGASGNITITTGDSSTTASGNIHIDSGANIINGTVVAAKTFESDVDGMDDWFNTTITTTSAQAHQGIQSLQVTPSSGFWGVTDDFNLTGAPVVPGHQYNFSAWVRAATTGRTFTGQIVWYPTGKTTSFSAVTDNNTGWTQASLTAPAPAGATNAFYRFQTSSGAAGEIHYFDDLVTTDLSSSSAFSAIEIGTTNAKVITIGNMNMISATSIMGASGISLNAGAANLTAVGGVLDFTGNSSSSIKTTSGGLTVSSAETAIWGVATSTSGNGGDLTLRAGNGEAFGDTNGGNLLLQAGKSNGIGTAGSVIVKPLSDSATAFQVQNVAGTSIVSVDTLSNKLLLANLEVSGHIITTGSAPAIAAGAAACTAPTVLVAGTDTAGLISVTTGSGCGATGTLATLTFSNAYGSAPRVVLTPADASAAGLIYYYDAATVSTTSFELKTSIAPANATLYRYSYQVIQ